MRRAKQKQARRLAKGTPGRLKIRSIRLQMRLTVGESELLDEIGAVTHAPSRSETLVNLIRAEGKRQGLPVPKTDNHLQFAGRCRACIACDEAHAEVVVDNLAGVVRPLCRACFEGENRT